MSGRRAASQANGNAESAFHALRARVELAASGCQLRQLVVAGFSSQAPGHRVALGLARAFGQSGMPVTLADSDSCRPVLHTDGGCDLEPGFWQWLSQPQSSIPRQCMEPQGVSLLSAGASGKDPLPILSASRLRQAMPLLTASTPLTIWNVPALQESAAGEVIAAQADATLLVVRPGRDRRSAAAAALQRLKHAGANVVGAVTCRSGGRRRR